MIWPDSLIQNIYNLFYQRGDFSLITSFSTERYQQDISETWAYSVTKEVCKILNVTSINKELLMIDIISSNVHSVVNFIYF